MAMSPRLLRPLASGVHPEAAAWRSAVVANGGSVSASTVKAVSTFCTAIDAAGIRDRFYRLSLMAGSNLNAALVPLYRGPAFGGTTYGNATDTNNNFVSGDYTETGGLDGDGSTTYLQTGISPASNAAITLTGHLSAHITDQSSSSFNALLGTDTGSAQNPSTWLVATGDTLYRTSGNYLGGNVGSAVNNTSTTGSLLLITRRSDSDTEAYKNGSSYGTDTSTFSRTGLSTEWYVFADNRNDSAIIHYGGSLGGYSIGASMTSEQVSAYYTAMQAFQQALGRNAT